MATLKAIIRPSDKRSDGTWNVKIRITHQRKTKEIPTSMYVTKKDITASFNIKNRAVMDKCDELILLYRQRLNALNLEVNDLPLSVIVERITAREERGGINFIAFAEKWLANNSAKRGLKNYITALNAFKKFFGREIILCEEITTRTMQRFEETLSDRPRACSLYTSAIAFLFKEARKYYNDEDNELIVIKNTIASYKAPKQNVAEKRSISEDKVREILALGYTGAKRRDFALDLFKLSLFLMGTNSVDLYNATQFDGEYLVYNRTKTKNRRADKAEMRIKVHPCLLPLFEKYKDTERVFDFHKRHINADEFNRTLNIGLKYIAKEVGLDNLQFYHVRHSFATIAYNNAKINKYLVNDMLCHVDDSMHVTELYIRKDYGPMNDANFQFIEYFLKK